jgi:hypothetical protein
MYIVNVVSLVVQSIEIMNRSLMYENCLLGMVMEKLLYVCHTSSKKGQNYIEDIGRTQSQPRTTTYYSRFTFFARGKHLDFCHFANISSKNQYRFLISLQYCQCKHTYYGYVVSWDHTAYLR